ncbi:MAG TPA: 2-amino-4-hydroxy-6-hydroxymethyldihydropteridine diphosphokinase [Firmicutes bacterium]|nr:2-amino-4-hydroxy-6-hydroxymethyldihydropteridine diphosphokinase [Bacillota bacterium]
MICYVGMGSNLGDRSKNLEHAAALMDKIEGTRINRLSSVYETEPVGYKEQGYFLNCVAKIFTVLPPRRLLAELNNVEVLLKRERLIPLGPRTIDLDILFYGNEIIHEQEILVVPHPRLTERFFVLVPLAELAPSLIHPGTGKSISQHLKELGTPVGIEKYS